MVGNRKCKVCGKDRDSGPNFSYHKLPTNDEKRRIWASLMGWSNICQDKKNIFICSDHFDPNDFVYRGERRYLKQDVNPVPQHSMFEDSIIRDSEKESSISEQDKMTSNTVIKTEEVDITEQMIDGNNIYERQEWMDNINSIVKLEDDTFMSDIKLEVEDDQFNLKQDEDHIGCKKENLKNDVDSDHMTSEQHKCHQCNYMTDYEADLKEHIDFVHLKIKHYQCHLCGYAARQKENLRNHIHYVHLKLTPYQCHTCGYVSDYKRKLKEHIILVHLKMRASQEYQCHLCDYDLRLKRHRKCQYCDFLAVYKRRLNKLIESIENRGERS